MSPVAQRERLSDMLRSERSLDEIRARLDELDHERRVEEVRSLAPRDVARLYERAAGCPAGFEHFVPQGVGPGQPVRHYGINSLPLFRRFEKRFMRAESGEERLWGYNHQPRMGITGPGYFVVDPPAAGDETVIDYVHVPSAQPGAGWPPVAENHGFPASLVYGNMRDRMRRVSEHVSVGHAYKHGNPMKAWFALVREV